MKKDDTSLLVRQQKNNPMSDKGIPSPFGFGAPPNLPPELAAKVDSIARTIQPQLMELAKIVHQHNLSCFDMLGGYRGIEVHLGVHNPNAPHDEFDFGEEHGGGVGLLESLGIKMPPGARIMSAGVIKNGKAMPFPPGAPMPAQAPQVLAPDLLEGVEAILRKIFREEDSEILGMVYSPYKSAAVEIAKIMEAARKRDQQEVAAELEKLVKRFRA